MEDLDKATLISGIRAEVTSYVSKWMIQEYPDFGKKWGAEVASLQTNISEAKRTLQEIKRDWDTKFRDHYDNFKKEINEFLSKDHPIFQELESIRNELKKFKELKALALDELRDDISSVNEKYKEYASFVKKISSCSSLFEDFYEIRDEIKRMRKKQDDFQEGLRKMFHSTSSINPATSIDTLDFSMRTLNCLNNANIETAGQLLEIPLAELKKFRNFGNKCLDEVKKFRKLYES